MLQLGKDIRNSVNDKLEKITLEELFEKISKPDLEMKNTIRRLRVLKNIDPKKYKESKTLLPYFTNGLFNPPYRKTENFAATQCFVLDLDNFAEGEKDLNSFRLKLAHDERVALLFISPGGDGLKVIFKLSAKCYDAAKYQMFYKLFAKEFNAQYEVNRLIDTKTSDVTRASFLSWDADCYFNEEAVPVKLENYIDFDSSDEVYEAEVIIDEIDKSSAKAGELVKEELPKDIVQQIKQRLKPETTRKKEKIYFVPEEVDNLMDKLIVFVESFNLKVPQVRDINFGRKFTVEADGKWCEINLFFGKKGFTLTKTPKRGSNDELAEVVLKVFYAFINEIQN